MSGTDLAALAAFAGASPVGIALVDTQGTVTLANRALCRLTGRDDLVGLPLVDLLDPDGPPVASLLAPATGVDAAERALVTAAGLRWCEVSAAPLPGFDGRLLHLQDRSEARALAREVHTGALLDAETGLAGGALLRDRLEHALALRDRDPHRAVSICVVDVPTAGALLEVATCVARAVRTTDTVARFGASIVLVCEDTDERGARALRHRLDGLPALRAAGACLGTATARSGQTAHDLLAAAARASAEVALRRSGAAA